MKVKFKLQFATSYTHGIPF